MAIKTIQEAAENRRLYELDRAEYLAKREEFLNALATKDEMKIAGASSVCTAAFNKSEASFRRYMGVRNIEE